MQRFYAVPFVQSVCKPLKTGWIVQSKRFEREGFCESVKEKDRKSEVKEFIEGMASKTGRS